MAVRYIFVFAKLHIIASFKSIGVAAMKCTMLRILMLSSALFLAPALVIAHHSFADQFDADKKITLKGIVSKVEWANPHIWIFLDVKEENGKVTNWGVEGGAPNILFRNGWRKDSLKVGDVLTVEGNKSKDGLPRANANRVTLPDGRRVFAGSSGGDSENPAPTP